MDTLGGCLGALPDSECKVKERKTKGEAIELAKPERRSLETRPNADTIV